MECRIETKKIFILDEYEMNAVIKFIGEISENQAIRLGVAPENIDVVFNLYDQFNENQG